MAKHRVSAFGKRTSKVKRASSRSKSFVKEQGVVPVLLGGALVVGAAYYLYNRGSQALKAEWTFQYVGGQDLSDDQSAQIVLSAVNPKRTINTLWNINSITGPTILLGGEQANPASVGLLVQIGAIPGISFGDKRIDSVMFKGFPVYVIRGWSAGDTRSASVEFANAWPNVSSVATKGTAGDLDKPLYSSSRMKQNNGFYDEFFILSPSGSEGWSTFGERMPLPESKMVMKRHGTTYGERMENKNFAGDLELRDW